MKTNNISIRHLRAFCEVAQQQSFTLAAKALFVTQSTLTTTVQQLEEQVGVKLFDRSTRKVYLTATGAEFLPTAQRLLFDFDGFLKDLSATAQVQRGQVAVAASPSFTSELLPAVVAQFHQAYPQVKTTLVDVTAQQIEQMVASHEVDFGIGSNRSGRQELSYTPLLKDSFGVVFPSDSAQAASSPATWADCQNQTVLELTSDTGIQAFLKLLPEPLGVEGVLSASSPATLGALVDKGLGVAILPALAASTAAFAGLTFRPLAEPRLERTLYLIERKERALSPAGEQFKALIIESLKTQSLPKGVVYIEPSTDD